MEIETYQPSEQPLKIKKRLRLQKQVAVACLGAYTFLVFNFLMGVFSEPVVAHYQYYLNNYGGKSRNRYVTDIEIYTDKGRFRSTQKVPDDFEEGMELKLWQTPFYSTTLRYQLQKPNEDIYWSLVNIYIVFSFFPILGLIGAVLCLLVKNDTAERYGFQLSIFSAIFLIFTCLIMGLM